MSGGWNTIESDAGVFTYLLESLGVKGVQFEELLSLDANDLAQLHPVYGVIFLFKYPTDKPYTSTDKPLDGEFDHEAAESLFFAAQTIQNACGTQALLSVLLNKVSEEGSGTGTLPNEEEEEEDTVDIGEALRDFREFTMPLPAEFRGEALSNSELIRGVHNSFARSSPFADETQRTGLEETEDAFHFVAYIHARGILYELDGLQPAPISHGPCGGGEGFATKVIEVLQRRIARYEASEIRFNLLAVVRDLRLRAEELGDSEALARENQKRWNWRFENALRSENFMTFGNLMLGHVVRSKIIADATAAEDGSEEAYKAWIEEATGKMRKRIELRQKSKGGGGGDGDVEMKG